VAGVCSRACRALTSGIVSLAGYAGMDGDDWQRLCLSVLREEHRDDLIPVPDHDRGDAGLEAYTLSGFAFQCYSPQEPLSTGQRYAKQRDKMTVDVGKFIGNGSKLRPMLGTVKIRQWVLLVPVIDSRDLLKHATAQTARMREARLDYADDEIHVVARDIEHYQGSLHAIVNRQLQKLYLPPLAEPDYAAVTGDLADTMRAKLSRVQALSDADKTTSYVQLLLTSYLGAREHRDYIRDYYPDLDDALEHELEDLEQRLESEYVLEPEAPERRLLRVKADAEERVRRALSHVRPGDARKIAEGQIADWLMRCQLDFPEPAAAGDA